MVFPLGITYYTYTFGQWAWQKGNRRGAVGIFALAALNLALAIYALYIKRFF
jgi:hypothetical protein